MPPNTRNSSKNYIVFCSLHKIGDLSLLELEPTPVSGRSDWKHIAKPVALPTEDLKITGKLCTVSGWGRLKSGGIKTQVFILMKEAALLNKEMTYFMSTCLL